METTLILTRGGLPPMSARGCMQELIPVSQGEFKRTVNGELIFIGGQAKKYKTIISCQDVTVIATNDLIPGVLIDVSCIQPLWQKVIGATAILERIPVTNSITVINDDRESIRLISCEGNNIEIDTAGSTEVISYVCYRPILTMRLVSYSLKINEWGLKSGWIIELEEV